MNTRSDATIAAESNKGHCILLIQFSPDDSSRTFLDYDDAGKMVDGICQLFEQNQKVREPQKGELDYDVKDLFAYLDSLKDFVALEYSVQIKGYEPRSRDWIKNKIFKGLKGQATTKSAE